MKLNKIYLMVMTTVAAAMASYAALADVDAAPVGDNVNGLPGPGIVSLVLLGIVAAVGIARRRK